METAFGISCKPSRCIVDAFDTTIGPANIEQAAGAKAPNACDGRAFALMASPAMLLAPAIINRYLSPELSNRGKANLNGVNTTVASAARGSS